MVRTLGAGAGLIAATGQSATATVWMITGTDVAGVSSGRLRAYTARACATTSRSPCRPGPDLPVPIWRRPVDLSPSGEPAARGPRGVGCVWCLALAVRDAAPVGAGRARERSRSRSPRWGRAGVGRELRRAALFAVPLGLAVMVVNALVVRDGLTVIVRLGDLPVLGQTDITLEATVYGAVLGLRAWR